MLLPTSQLSARIYWSQWHVAKSTYLLEDVMATLLKEIGIFQSYVDAHHLRTGGCHACTFIAIDWNRTRWSHTSLGMACTTPLIYSTCPPLSACYLPLPVISAQADKCSGAPGHWVGVYRPGNKTVPCIFIPFDTWWLSNSVYTLFQSSCRFETGPHNDGKSRVGLPQLL